MGFWISRLFFGFLPFPHESSFFCTPTQCKECIIYFVFASFLLPFRRGSDGPGETDMDDEVGEVD